MPARQGNFEPQSSSTSVNIATAFNQAAAARGGNFTTPLPRTRNSRGQSSSNYEDALDRVDIEHDDSFSSPKFTAYLKERPYAGHTPFPNLSEESPFLREEELLGDWSREGSEVTSPFFREEEIMQSLIKSESEGQEAFTDSSVEDDDDGYDSPTPIAPPFDDTVKAQISPSQPPTKTTTRGVNILESNTNGNNRAPILDFLNMGLGFIAWPIGLLLNFIGFLLFFILGCTRMCMDFIWGNLTGHGQFTTMIQAQPVPQASTVPVVPPTTIHRRSRIYWIILILLLLWLLFSVRLGKEERTPIDYLRDITFPSRSRLNDTNQNLRIPTDESGGDSGFITIDYLRSIIADEVRTKCQGLAPSANNIIEPHLVEIRGFISSEVTSACAANSEKIKSQLLTQVNDGIKDVEANVQNDINSRLARGINEIKTDVDNNISGLKSELNSNIKDDVAVSANGIKDEIRNKVDTDVNEAKISIKNDLDRDINNVRSQLNNEIDDLKSNLIRDMNSIKSELNTEIYNIRNEIKVEVRHDIDDFRNGFHDIKAGIKNDIKDDVKSLVKDELKAEVKNEVRNDISNEVRTQISKTKHLRTTTLKGGEELMEVIRSEARSIVQEELLVFSQDTLNRPDFALHSGGAKIISRLTSKTYEIWPDKWYQKLFASFSGQGVLRGKPPVTAISPDTHVGQCWPFPGQEGQLAILLNRRVYVTAITYDHVSRRVAVDVLSAPKDFDVWGIIGDGRGDHARDSEEESVNDIFKETIEGDMESTEEECNIRLDGQYVTHKSDDDDVPTSSKTNSVSDVDPRLENATSGDLKLGSSPLHLFLGSYSYDISGLPVQTFEVPESIRQANKPVIAIIMRVKSNWGKPGYTCLYRLRVHGDPADQTEPM